MQEYYYHMLLNRLDDLVREQFKCLQYICSHTDSMTEGQEILIRGRMGRLAEEERQL